MEEISWLCRLGLHKWAAWEFSTNHIFQVKTCIRCRLCKGRKVEVDYGW